MAFHPLAPLDTLHDGYLHTFTITGIELLLIQQQGEQFLIENRCGHFGVPLETGRLYGRTIECSQHYIRFDLQSGAVMGQRREACDPLRVFTPIVIDGMVGIEL